MSAELESPAHTIDRLTAIAREQQIRLNDKDKRIAELEARYAKLKHAALSSYGVRFIPTYRNDSEPFVLGTDFYGETFEDAVDSLDEPPGDQQTTSTTP